MGFPLSPKSPIGSSPTGKPISSSGNDENVYGMERDSKPRRRIGSGVQALTNKHFMASTVFAASKAVTPPRKNVLAERNCGAPSGFTFSDAQFDESPNLDLEFKFKQLGISDSSRISGQFSPILSPSRFSGSGYDDHDDEGASFVPDSTNRPYDPLTNYLSPRPKFLRYNPNRRREMFALHQSESEEGEDGVVGSSTSDSSDRVKGFDDGDSSVCGNGSADDSPSLEGWLEQASGGNEFHGAHDDEAEENVVEEIEEEVGRYSGLKGLLKLLLVLVLLVLSGAYISSMNSPTPPPALVYLRGLKDEYLKIEDRVYRAISVRYFEGEVEYLDDMDESKMGREEIGEVKAEVNLVDPGDAEKNESEGAHEQGVGREMACETVDEIELQQTQISEVIESMEDYQMMTVIDLMNVHETMLHSAEAHGNSNDIDLRNLEQSSSEGHMKEPPIVVVGHEEAKADGVSDADEGHMKEPPIVVVGHEEAKTDGVSDADEGHMKEPPIVENKMEELHTEAENTEEPPTGANNVGGRGMDVEWMEEVFGKLESWSISKNVIWAAIFTCGVVSLAVSLSLSLHSRSKRDAANCKSSVPNEKQCSEVGTPKRSRTEFPTIGNKDDEQNKHAFTLINPPSYCLPNEDRKIRDAPAPVRSGAPKVELLGEYDFGEACSSLKSSIVRSMMTERRKESVHLIPQARKGYSISSHLQASPSEVSTTSAEEVADDRGGEAAKKMVSTPVRRSSRIRSRGVKSP